MHPLSAGNVRSGVQDPARFSTSSNAQGVTQAPPFFERLILRLERLCDTLSVSVSDLEKYRGDKLGPWPVENQSAGDAPPCSGEVEKVMALLDALETRVREVSDNIQVITTTI